MIEKRLRAILKLALNNNASDIHLIEDKKVFIELRIANKLYKVKEEPDIDQKLIRYLQYIASLDVGNKLKPQSGQFDYELDGELLSLRFAYLYNQNKINAVIRILNSNRNLIFAKLSDEKNKINEIKKLLNNRSGLILFCGPTGSGKTTSLYALLNDIKDKRVISIEDPIEIKSKNFLQLQINENINFDYNAAIKQLLRHDPDIIMIGEIRDEKAAKAAVRAANTGHLVLSSIHAKDALFCIKRLIDLGINKEQLDNLLIAIINQRLVFDPTNNKKAIFQISSKQELDSYFNDENKKVFKNEFEIPKAHIQIK